MNNAKTKEKGILEHKEASIHGTYSAKDLHIAFPANFAMQEDYLDNVNWIAVNKNINALVQFLYTNDLSSLSGWLMGPSNEINWKRSVE